MRAWSWIAGLLAAVIVAAASSTGMAQTAAHQATVKACEKGDGAKCVTAGNDFNQGVGVAKDFTKAYSFYDRACRLKNGDGCHWKGDFLERGEGVASDMPKAVDAYEASCRLGTKNACTAAIDVLFYSYEKKYAARLPKKDFDRAYKLALFACEQKGLGAQCHDIGYMMSNGHVPGKTAKDGLAYYNTACGKLTAAACHNIGFLYFNGATGVPKDIKAAANFYEKACHYGRWSSCWNLTNIIYDNISQYPEMGGQRDSKRARVPFEYACNNDVNIKNSCFRAGYIASGGDGGTEVNKGYAAWAYLKGCKAGSAIACYNAGVVYKDGNGYARSALELQLLMYDAACQKGDTQGCERATKLRSDYKVKPHSGAQRGIDPMLAEYERFILAESELYGGDFKVGIETMEWLAEEGNANANYVIGMMQRDGAGGYQPNDFKARRNLERAWRRGHPQAGLEHARLIYQPQMTMDTQLQFDRALNVAVKAGVPEAVQWKTAIDQRQEAYLAERHRNLVAQARANRAAERATDNATVARAWAQYYQRQVENAPEQVCALIYEGGRADRRCMAKSHFDKYYRP